MKSVELTDQRNERQPGNSGFIGPSVYGDLI